MATPAPKHPIVNTLLLVTIFRSFFNALPSLVHEAAPNALILTNGTTSLDIPAMAHFCIADAIMYDHFPLPSCRITCSWSDSLRFFTVVQAALGISFTLVRHFSSLWRHLIHVLVSHVCIWLCDTEDHGLVFKVSKSQRVYGIMLMSYSAFRLSV